MNTFQISVESETIKIEGSKHFTIQLDYNVHHTTIPLKSSIPITVGVDNRCMTECLNDKEADKERQRWVDFVLSYRMTPVFGTQITPERWQYEHSFSPWAWNDKRSIRLLNDRRYSCYMLPFFTLSENELASLLCNIQKKGKLKESLFYIWDEPAYIGMCNYFRRNAFPTAVAETGIYRDSHDDDKHLYSFGNPSCS